MTTKDARAPRRDLAPSSAAGGFLDDSMRWERLFINEIKTLKAGSKDQLESLTELASNDASKRYKSIVNIVSKYAQVMKPKYRPSLMYVISSLIMHENPKVSSLYRQRFAIEISVLVERICECRLEQLATVRRSIERWREKGCLESSVLDECEYHVQKFEEAGKEADEEERRKVEDGLLGMERIETPPPPEEEEEEKKEKEEKPMTNTNTTMVNRWPKLIPAKINNAQHQKQQNNKNRKRKRNSDANINNNRQKFTNDNFRQRQQNKPPMNQQQIQQSQHGQGKPSKTQKRRMNRQKFANKKKQDNNGNNKDQKQQQQEKGEKDDQKKPIIDKLT